VKDVMQALKDALSLIDQRRLPYLTANSTERRLINQAISIGSSTAAPITPTATRRPSTRNSPSLPAT
jgi:hypothetical protein